MRETHMYSRDRLKIGARCKMLLSCTFSTKALILLSLLDPCTLRLHSCTTHLNSLHSCTTKSHIVGVSSIGGELATPTRSPERDARQRYGPMQSHVLHGRVVARIDANEWSRLMMRWHIDDHNYHKNGTSARLREYARYCRVVLCEPTLSPAL